MLTLFTTPVIYLASIDWAVGARLPPDTPAYPLTDAGGPQPSELPEGYQP